MGIFLVALISGLTFQQSIEVDIKIVCINAGYCTSSAVCNVSIFAPDQTTLLDGIQATQAASLAFYNVTLNSTQTVQIGEYSVGGFCKDGSVTQLIDFSFDVTPTGKVLTTGDSILTTVLTVGVFFMFLFTFWGGLVLPFKNKRNDASEIIEIEKLKYFKIVLLTLSYTLLVWLSNLLFTLSISFSLLSQMTGFFQMTFEILLAFSYVVFVVTIIFMFVLGWRDLKLRELLLRGLPAR